MKVSPISGDIIVGSDPHVWVPRTFSDFLKELEHIKDASQDRLLVFRGQANRRWLLESTFARNCKGFLLGVGSWVGPSQEEIRESVEYHQALFALFLFKYDLFVRPSPEPKDLEQAEGIDPIIEKLKSFQQYPESDRSPLKGTFFMDWSRSDEVAIFFANYDADEHSIRARQTDGALFICDTSVTGKTLMRKGPAPVKVEEIVRKMVEAHNDEKVFGCPLLFHPPKQLASARANNQEAVYWAQMDLRYDLEYIWALREEQLDDGERVYVKLILPYQVRQECDEYLSRRGKTHGYLFPD